MHPYFPKKADAFSPGSLAALLSLDATSHGELQDQAIAALCCFTALRSSDIRMTKRRMITSRPGTSHYPRHFHFQLDRTKTDPDGTGPEDDRKFLLPCICLVGKDQAGKKAFLTAQKNNPSTPCCDVCPYGIVQTFLHACPTQSASSPANLAAELPFARALTAKGDRTLTCNPLGAQTIRGAIPRVNERLPEEVRLKRATGHSGRHTVPSIVMNTGGDSMMAAAATKHKNPEVMKGYVKMGTGVLMGAALHIANVLPHNDKSSHDNISDAVNSEHSESIIADHQPTSRSTSSSVVPVLQKRTLSQSFLTDSLQALSSDSDSTEVHSDRENKQQPQAPVPAPPVDAGKRAKKPASGNVYNLYNCHVNM